MKSSKPDKLKGNQRKSRRKEKLPRGSKIRTRPILHPPIPSPYAGADQRKVIYVSAGSPFIAVIKRVRKLLSLIQKRTVAKTDLLEGKLSDKQKLKSLANATAAAKEKKPEAVFLKATNRAIDKALNIALFLKEQEDLLVRLKTGTVAVVDDIVPEEALEDAAEGRNKSKDKEGQETRVRHLSVLEVSITMK